jgi:hypothetical protein
MSWVLTQSSQMPFSGRVMSCLRATIGMARRSWMTAPPLAQGSAVMSEHFQVGLRRLFRRVRRE